MSASLSILLVEDEALIAMDLEWKLREAGYRVTGRLARGEEAVESALRDRPDVILMDDHLAGEIDGIEAALRIRAQSPVPIIFMTGYHLDERFFERVGPVGPAACLNKPLVFEDLLGAIVRARKA